MLPLLSRGPLWNVIQFVGSELWHRQVFEPKSTTNNNNSLLLQKVSLCGIHDPVWANPIGFIVSFDKEHKKTSNSGAPNL